MPKYEDLEFIRDNIIKIGNEVEVKKNLNEPFLLTPLPEKIDIIEEEEPAVELESILDDIKDDFEEGLLIEDDIESSNGLDIDEFTVGDAESDLLEGFSDLDIQPDKEVEIDEWADLREDSFKDLDTVSIEDGDKPDLDNDGSFEMSELLNGLDAPVLSEDSDNEDNQDFNIEDISDDFSVESSSDLDLDALFGETSEKTDSPIEDGDDGISTNSEEIEATNDALDEYDFGSLENVGDLQDESDSLAIDGDSIFENEPSDIGEESKSGDSIDDFLSDLSLDGDASSELEDLDGAMVTDGDDLLNLAGDFAESSSIEPDNAESEISNDFMTDLSFDNDNADNKEEVAEEIEDFDAGDLENLDALTDGEQLEDLNLNLEETTEPLDNQSDEFNFADLESFSVDNTSEEQNEDIFADVTSIGEMEKDEETPPVDTDNIKTSESEQTPQSNNKISLNDDDRKQIITTLSSLPREAEIKIAKLILDDKYDDKRLKPLIDALKKEETIQTIVKIYEKISGDASLSKLQSVKFTGQEFEEKQKSLAYIFQKNILPIIYRVAASAIALLVLVLLYVKIIQPTVIASVNYKTGKKNIVSRSYDAVEPYFEKAYKIQPRYGEVLEFARMYRERKRYINSEKKYNLALKMKQNKNLKLEIADFYREIEDFERSIRAYDELKSINDKDIPTLLGMAKTYMDWSKMERNRLESAKELYFDILDLDKKNKEATYGKMKIAVIEDDYDEVMKHYRHIEKTFKDNIDPEAYIFLADYLLKSNKIEEVKNILDKATIKVKNKLYPELNYYYARYNKSLNLFGEEKIQLDKALNKFEILKTSYPEIYSSLKYRNILSDLYNDIGENFDRTSRASIEAEKYFNKSIEMNPENGKPYYNLGNFALKYKIDLENAKNNFLEAEKLGFTNDSLYFYLGWINYKQSNFTESLKRINFLLEKNPSNSNLKLFAGTIFYKLGNYDFAEGFLLEIYNRYVSLKQIYYPLEMDIREDRIIAENLVNISNNLGAAYQKKYENTRNSKFIVWATKYYSDSIEYYDKLKESPYSYVYETNSADISSEDENLKKFTITDANQNLRMVLYPDAALYEPILYEDFPLDYESLL